MNAELEKKDALLDQAAKKIEFNKEEMQTKIQFYEMNQNNLVYQFEKERNELRHEIAALNEGQKAMEIRTQALDRAIERQDELENLVISLRRSKEDYQLEIANEMQEIREQNREFKNLSVERNLQIENLIEKKNQMEQELKSEQSRRQELDEQLTSLRFLWSTKAEESESLKISVASLEKLNAELSHKLNELRKKSEGPV